jgi:hypothetical protein
LVIVIHSIALLNFGLYDKNSTNALLVAAGVLMAIDGLIMLLLSCKYPPIFAATAPDDEPAMKGPGQV